NILDADHGIIRVSNVKAFGSWIPIFMDATLITRLKIDPPRRRVGANVPYALVRNLQFVPGRKGSVNIKGHMRTERGIRPSASTHRKNCDISLLKNGGEHRQIRVGNVAD